MRKLIATAFLFLLLSSTALAQSNLATDENGNITGTVDGKRVNMRTDQFGNTRGTIGGAKINTHTDKLGNITGTVGKTAINTNLANTNTPVSGAIGKAAIKPRVVTSPPPTAGAIGNSILNTYTGDDQLNTSGKTDFKNINKKSSDKLNESFD